MSTYAYTAKSAPDRLVQGDIEAESGQEAVNKLSKMGLFPVSVKSEDFSSLRERRFWQGRKISSKELLLFTAQLSTLIDSGVNILNALKLVSAQSHNRFLKSVLNDIIDKIKDGRPLSDSLSRHPYLFSALYSAMIRTGEVSGSLNIILRRLADFLEQDEEFKESLRASLTYPVFVLFVSILTIFVLLVFVVPRLVTMFEDMGQILPLPTRILINTSGALRNYWWLIIGIFILSILLLGKLYRRPQVRIYLDNLRIKITLFGPIILKTEISRLTRTLSLLLSSGLPINTSLDISASVLGNQILKFEVQRFKEKIGSGQSLSESLKSSRFFSDFVTNIIAVGEESGVLDKSLGRIADDYEKEVNNKLKAISRIFEPLIILIMGLVVGFIVLAMLLPIFQINLTAI